jgi:flagellar basal-body rod protein FlgC
MALDRLGFPMTVVRPLVRPLFRSLSIPASGLSAQRQRIDVIASNIANAETTRTAEGGPYRRRVVELEARAYDPRGEVLMNGGVVVRGGVATVVPPEVPRVEVPSPAALMDPTASLGGVRVAGVVEDTTEGPLVYDPGHPDADEMGYVRYPNVRITDEMVNLLEARRAYEANATVFQAVKSMLRRAIEI